MTVRINGTRIEIGSKVEIKNGHYRHLPGTYFGRQSGRHQMHLVKINIAPDRWKIVQVHFEQLTIPKPENSMLEAVESLRERAENGENP